MRKAAVVLRWQLIALFVDAIAPLAFAEQSANHQLFMIRPDGTDLRQITQRPDYRFGAPVFSPDGKRIAADCARADQTLQDARLVVMDADGSNHCDLCPGSMPAWSPNGRLLAFHTYSPSAIMVMDVDGSGAEEVANHWGSPRWSPEGAKIICLHSDQTLRTIDLKTGIESTMLAAHRAYQGFSLSADGRRLCFGNRSRGGISIGTVNKGTMRGLKHFMQGSICTFCSWSPDGERIVFSMTTGQGGNKSQLFLLDASSERPPVRLEGQDPEASNVNPQWSPNGEWILFSSDLAE
jgi:Tol biopolymer transport system component